MMCFSHLPSEQSVGPIILLQTLFLLVLGLLSNPLIVKIVKRKLIVVTAILFGLSAFPSCKKYLDVQPNDKFLESQLFSSKTGIESALNNIYLQMANSPLYG